MTIPIQGQLAANGLFPLADTREIKGGLIQADSLYELMTLTDVDKLTEGQVGVTTDTGKAYWLISIGTPPSTPHEWLELFPEVVFPNKYYVDFSLGNDSTGNGSPVTPWATIAHAASVISSPTAPTVIYLSGGNSTETAIINIDINISLIADTSTYILPEIVLTGSWLNVSEIFTIYKNIFFNDDLSLTLSNADILKIALENCTLPSSTSFIQNGTGGINVLAINSVFKDLNLRNGDYGSYQFLNCKFHHTLISQSPGSRFIFLGGYSYANMSFVGETIIISSGFSIDIGNGASVTYTNGVDDPCSITTDSNAFTVYTGDDPVFKYTTNIISATQKAAFDAANSPSITNPLATLDDLGDGSVPQNKIIYRSNVGNDINNGLTIDQAISSIQRAMELIGIYTTTPNIPLSINNQWVVYCADADYASNAYLIPYTHLCALALRLTGVNTMQGYSYLRVRELFASGSSMVLNFTGGTGAGANYVKAEFCTNGIIQADENQGHQYVNIQSLVYINSAQPLLKIYSGSTIHLTSQKAVGNITLDGATSFVDLRNVADISGLSFTLANGATDSQILVRDKAPNIIEAVVVISTSQIDLTGEQTIDVVSLISGNRVLVNGQLDSTTNGVYVCSATAWARASDAATGDDIAHSSVYVTSGISYGGDTYYCNNNFVVIGSSAISYGRLSQAGGYWTRNNNILSPKDTVEIQQVQTQGYSFVSGNTSITMFSTFFSNLNAEYSIGNPTGYVSGSGVVISGNALTLSNSTGQLYYLSNASLGLAQIIAIKFKIQTLYAGIPATSQQIIAHGTYGSINNRIYMQHTLTGFLQIEIRDSAGNIILLHNFGTWSPNLLVEYEFELNCNFTAGIMQLFINGIQLGPTATPTGVRNGNLINYLGINGRPNPFSGTANFKIKDLVVHSSIQHTSNYTPGYTLQNTRIGSTASTLSNLLLYGTFHLQSMIQASSALLTVGTDGEVTSTLTLPQNIYYKESVSATFNGIGTNQITDTIFCEKLLNRVIITLPALIMLTGANTSGYITAPAGTIPANCRPTQAAFGIVNALQNTTASTAAILKALPDGSILIGYSLDNPQTNPADAQSIDIAVNAFSPGGIGRWYGVYKGQHIIFTN